MTKTPVSLIGLPYLMGTRTVNAGYHMAKGPLVLLDEAATPALVRQTYDDVEVIMIENADEPTAENTGGDYRLLPIGDQMSRILVQNIQLAKTLREERAKGRIAVVSAGTCSSSFGMVGGLGDVEGPIGMVWFDAHGDAQTPDTSRNGFIEGMTVTTIAGKCWPIYRRQIPGFREIPEENIITVGLSEAYSPNARAHANVALGQLVHPPKMAELGFEGAMIEALDKLRERCDKVYIHFDTDVLDIEVLRANSHAAPGGITDTQAMRAFDLIAERFEILTLSMSSYDPNVDPRGPSVLPPILAKAVEAIEKSRQGAV